MSLNKEDKKNNDEDEDNIKDNINKINDLSFLEHEFNQKEPFPFEDKSFNTEHDKSELCFPYDHHLDDFNLIQAIEKQFPNLVDHPNTIFRKTEYTSIDLTERKIRREKSKGKEILEKDYNEKEKINTNQKELINEHTKGRKKKVIYYKGDAPHNKSKEDNIIRKIKTFLFQHILNKLNGSLKNKHDKFYRLNKYLNEEIKKNFNENLLARTIYDIYKNPHLNLKGKATYKDKLNSKLIDKIYEEKIEVETISILEKTFNQILDDIRESESDLDNFLNEIRKKEVKNGNPDTETYIGLVKNVLFRYEDCFFKKKGRNTKNK